MRRRLRRSSFVAVAALVLATLAPVGAPVARAVHVPGHCDPIDTTQCLLPFPSDYFTVAAPTHTGRRVQFPVDVMPVNGGGTPIDPADWNRNDGFSPGATIMVRAGGLDVAQSGIAPSSDIGASLDPEAPIVLLDAVTGERVPYWGELDTWNPNAATRALVVRPARNFREGHRILVALRNLKNAAGQTLPAPAGFAALRDDVPTANAALEARRPAIERVLDDLAAHGVQRDDLYLAWDFTVASWQNIAGRMLWMRDDAYAELGTGVPDFDVTIVDENVSANVLRRVRGTFEVPLYLTNGGVPGSRLALDAFGRPQQTGTFAAEFRCIIPRSVVDEGGRVQRARGIVYGHGLLGGTGEVEGTGTFANEKNMVVCATPWIGMSSGDIGNVANVIADFSTFGSMPDRLQQGFLNFQFLARLIKDPRGFGSDPAFQAGRKPSTVFAPQQVFFNGNSQGGILGGAATAISKEWTKAVLGVPAMNYSVLLPRSVDFDPFLPLVQAAYPDPTVHTLIVALIQMLWDRGDGNGYAQHLTTDPYPRTPQHDVLLIEAFGDHQVANVGTENMARTIGARVRQPALAPGRSNDVEPMWDIPPVPHTPYHGSVLEIWDFGTPAPPVESVPPRAGTDPHGAARNVPEVRETVSRFLQHGGKFYDLCGAGPCVP
jgi:hypothetical protein